MRTIKTDTHSFTFYDSIKEISVAQYKEFVKATLIDSGIGADLAAIRDKVINIWSFIDADKKDLARNELNNLFIATNYIVEKASPLSECFLYLLRSIDNEKIDFSELDEIDKDEIKKKIEEIPFSQLESIIDEVKKNSTLN